MLRQPAGTLERPRLPRKWRRRKWIVRLPLSVSGLIAAVWLFSTFTHTQFWMDGTGIFLNGGVITLQDQSIYGAPKGLHLRNHSFPEQLRVTCIPDRWMGRLLGVRPGLVSIKKFYEQCGLIMPSFERSRNPLVRECDLKALTGGSEVWTHVNAPLWIPFCISLFVWGSLKFILPVPQLYRCFMCRYDLRQNQSGTCPECGEPIPDDQIPFIQTEQMVDPANSRRE